MNEAATRHGKLIESAHIAGYTFERAMREMEWLLTEGRWRTLGFEDVEDFAASIKLGNMRLIAEQRKKISKLLTEAGVSQRQSARTLGVGLGTVQRDIDPNGSPDADADAETAESDTATDPSGSPGLSGEDVAKLGEKQERKDAAAAETKAQREASRSAAVIPDGLDLRIGDAREVLDDVADESVSLVLTDPPYGDESEPLYQWLSEWSARVLVPGGSLVCYTGQSYLPRDLELLGQSLRYWWLLSMPHAQPQRMAGKFVMISFKPVLWFVKGSRRGRRMVSDVLYSPSDKTEHGWGQGEAGVSMLIEQLTDPKDLIADPFAGSMLWGKIAHKMGRRWVGADLAVGGREVVVA